MAQKLGFAQQAIAGVIPGPSDEEIGTYLQKKLEPFAELSLEALKKAPVLAPGNQEIAFSDYIFPTPSGKIELFSQQAEQLWGVDPLPNYFEPVESVRRDSAEFAKYPLYFLTPNTKDRIHSQFNNLSLIRQLSPKPTALLHPQDAHAREIKNGDRIKIFNNRGELKVEAHIDFGSKPGTVYVTNGWWLAEGGTVNLCSSGRETDMGHGAAFHDNLVEVEKI